MSKKTKISDFHKNCPKCNTILYYCSNSAKNQAIRKNKLCNSCTQIGKKASEETKLKMSLIRQGDLHPLYGKHHREETKEKIRIAHVGKDYNTIEYKEELRKRFSGKNNPKYGKGYLITGENNPFYGKHHTEENKQKARENRLRNGKNNYNPKACEYFNKLNEEKKWNLQHALNGGEIDCIGYSLDAYDKDRNIVIEYDESHHNLPSIKERDLVRQNRIINHLKCQFYRFNETNNNLYQVV